MMVATIPDSMMFGFECEVSSGSDTLAERLYEVGLLPEADLHSYHCGCDGCDPDPDRAHTFHAQEDCTVAGEFISKPLKWSDPRAHEDIAALSREAVLARVEVGDNAGCHVHVSADLLKPHHRCNIVRVVNAFEDDFALYARGKSDEVRSYNFPNAKPSLDRWSTDHQIDRGGHQSWVDVTRYQTVEFRLWNGTVTDWRVRLYAALSLATVTAVLHGAVPAPYPNMRLHDFLADYLPAGSDELLERQREYANS